MAAADFPISDVVQVNITRETLFPSRSGFSTLLIVGSTDVIDHGERVRFYTSIEGVDGDFAADDEEYLAAQTAFSQSPRPTRIAIGRAVDADQAGYMRTGAIGTLGAFQAITDGEFRTTIDGDAQDISGLNFSGAADLDDVASIIETALQAVGSGGFTAATCTHSAGRLTITSGTSGASSAVTFVEPDSAPVGTDISGPTLMNGRQGVAVMAAGHVYSDMAGELSAIQAASDDWYGVALTQDLRSSANYLSAAAWIESRKKLLAVDDTSLTAIDAQSAGDVPSLIQAQGYHRSGAWWNDDPGEYLGAGIFAQVLTADFSVPNSSYTGKFKQVPGCSPVSISASQLQALKDKNCNTYVTRGGISMTEEGEMASGEFLDVMHGVDWMEDAMAVEVFGALVTAPNIPLTDAGAAVLESKVREVLDQAVAAGFIATDFDDDGDLVPAYKITRKRVLDLPASQRAARQGPAITFTARLAGAIHFQTVSGTVTV